MKAIVYLLAGSFLLSFSSREGETLDGVWTGAYRTENLREKVWVKFDEQNGLACYNGEVQDGNKSTGSYRLQGDTLLVLSYVTGDGTTYTMQGYINKKKNYVDGTWKTNDRVMGSFYLKKEKLEEMFIEP